MSAVSATTSTKPSVQNPAAQEEPLSWNETLFKVGKVVLCALIPLVSLLIAYWIVPETWGATVIPFVAVCSVAVAVLGYKHLTATDDVSSNSVEKEKVREPLPPGAPRGIVNKGNNCWAASLAQTLYADAGIRSWLMSNKCPPELKPFHDFMHAYDRAVAENAFVVTMKNDKGETLDPAQELRKCLARMRTPEERANGSGISSRNRQEDPDHGWKKIYGFLPHDLTSSMSSVRKFHRPRSLPRPRSMTWVQQESPIVSLSGKHAKMEQLMDRYFNASGEGDDLARVDGHEYQPKKTVTRYVEAPPSLWIQFNRFKRIGKLVRTSEGREYQERTIKVTTNVDILTKYDLPLVDKKTAPYKLHSFLVHHGEFGGGHYTSYTQAEDGQWYKLDDSDVTPISEEKALEIGQQAYLLQYSRVDSTD